MLSMREHAERSRIRFLWYDGDEIEWDILQGPPPMSTLTVPPLTAAPSQLVPELYRLTVDQYELMVQTGVLTENDRVELINGLLRTKTSKNTNHILATKKGLRALQGIIGKGWHAAKEDPVRIPDRHGEPEPDVSIVRGTPEDYARRIPEPGDVALVVEVSDSTLEYDREEKLPIYAAAGIPIYWIINLIDRQVEVYSIPTVDGYQVRQAFVIGHEVPVVIDNAEVGRIPVADLLP
jgi:Uma2 family endonuclease